MDTKQIHESILHDLNNSKEIKNIKTFKANLHNFSKEELEEVADSIECNIYLGQHGVDDLAWINLKKLIKAALDS